MTDILNAFGMTIAILTLGKAAYLAASLLPIAW